LRLYFAVWGPGATQPVTVADSVQFRVQTRDAFGNNRVDDGEAVQGDDPRLTPCGPRLVTVLEEKIW